jgi:uncharacterized protein YggE
MIKIVLLACVLAIAAGQPPVLNNSTTTTTTDNSNRTRWGTITVTGQGKVQINTTFADISMAISVRSSDVPRNNNNQTVNSTANNTANSSSDASNNTASNNTASNATSSSDASSFSAADVQAEVARRLNSVMTALRNMSNIQKLRTTYYNLQPVFSWDSKNMKQTFTGYLLETGIGFRCLPDQVGQVIDSVIGKGVNRVDSVSFVGGDDAIDAARLSALDKAVQSLNQQALTVLRRFGIQAEPEPLLLSLDQASLQPPQPMPLMAPFMDASGASMQTQLVPGTQEVSAIVTAQLRYRLPDDQQ